MAPEREPLMDWKDASIHGRSTLGDEYDGLNISFSVAEYGTCFLWNFSRPFVEGPAAPSGRSRTPLPAGARWCIRGTRITPIVALQGGGGPPEPPGTRARSPPFGKPKNPPPNRRHATFGRQKFRVTPRTDRPKAETRSSFLHG